MRSWALFDGILRAPPPFADASVERHFQRRIRGSRLRFELQGFWIAFGLITVMGVIRLLQAESPGADPLVQICRLLIALTLFSVILFIKISPWRMIRHHDTVSGCAIALCTSLFAVIVIRVSVSAGGSVLVLVMSALLTIWLLFALSYLPLRSLVLVTLPCNVAILYSVVILSRAEIVPVVFHLAVANICGVAVRQAIERRDRDLYLRSARLRAAKHELDQGRAEAVALAAERWALLSFVAHDLRQPIASLGLYISSIDLLARSGKIGEQGFQKSIDSLKVCAALMQSNVDRLLRTKTSGEVELVPPLENGVIWVFDRVLAVMKPRAEAVGVELLSYLPSDLVCDLNSRLGTLVEIINNLVDNSVKFRNDKQGSSCWVLIGGVRLGSVFRIDVIDNGRGIASQNLHKIFDEGWRESSGGASGVPGSGLGLASVRAMLKELGEHKISVASREGVYTRVRLYVPIARRDHAPGDVLG